jgi:hypothetical protein
VRDIPVFTFVSPNQVAEATSSAGAAVTYPDATAKTVGPAPVITYSQLSGSVFPLGYTTVTVTATSTSGDQATRTFTVSVQDTTPPAFSFVSPNLVIEATMPSGAVVPYAAAVATDAVGPVSYEYSQSSGSVFALGTTTVYVEAEDGAGNSTVVSFTVLVRDTTPPVITSISPDVVINATSAAGAVVTYAPATATDAVGATIFYNLASGTVFPIGTTTVVVAAVDNAGNYSFQTFMVTVQDAPVITSVSPNLTLSAAGGSSALVTYAPAAAMDVAGPVSVMYAPPSGALFPVGTTTVTVTAISASLVMTTAIFTITITP